MRSCEPQGDSECPRGECRYPEIPVVYQWQQRHKRGQSHQSIFLNSLLHFPKCLITDGCFVLLMPTDDSLVSFPHCKVAGATEADLSIRATQNRQYVCRVNDISGKSVFSDWVKVKVLDIDKTGMLCYFHPPDESTSSPSNNACCACPMALYHLRQAPRAVFHHQVCLWTGRGNHTLPSTQNPQQSRKVTNSLYTVLPLVSLPHTTSGTEMGCNCPQVLLTLSRYSILFVWFV